jgi:hypothetical protein
MNDTKDIDLDQAFAALLFGVFVLGGYVIWEVINSEQGQRVLEAVVKAVTAGILAVGMGTNYVVRYLVGLVCDLIGPTEKVAKVGLWLVWLGPFAGLFAFFVVGILAVAFKLPFLVLIVTLLMMVSVAVLPLYYWGQVATNIPYIGTDLATPFLTERLMRKEEQIVKAEVQITLAQIRLVLKVLRLELGI